MSKIDVPVVRLKQFQTRMLAIQEYLGFRRNRRPTASSKNGDEKLTSHLLPRSLSKHHQIAQIARLTIWQLLAARTRIPSSTAAVPSPFSIISSACSSSTSTSSVVIANIWRPPTLQAIFCLVISSLRPLGVALEWLLMNEPGRP